MTAKEIGIQLRCTTDANGRFACADVPVGELPVLACADGFAACFARVQTSKSQPADTTLSLQRGASVRGRVTQRDGTPFAGATVRVDRRVITPGFRLIAEVAGFSRETRTDADGRYAFDAVFPDRTRLWFEGRGDVTAERLLELHDGEVCVRDLTLAEGADLSGSVVDADGKPVRGVRVACRSRSDGRERTTTADAEGHFAFPGQPAADYAVAAFDVRMAGAAALVPLASVQSVHPGDAPLLLRVETRPADRGWIEGRVVWPAGAEKKKVELSLYAQEPARRAGSFYVPQERLAAGTDTFRIGPLPPGEYRLLCDTEGRDRLQLLLRLGPAETLQAPPFRLDEQQPLRLRLRYADGRAVRGARVVLDRSGQGIGPTCSEEPPGLYRSQALSPGTFTVNLRGADFAPERFAVEATGDPQRVVEHEVQAAATTTLRFSPPAPVPDRWIAAMKLRLLDATGAALVDEMVQVDGRDHYDWPIGLRPGSYTLITGLWPLGSGAAKAQFTVEAAAPAARIVDVQLRR